MLLPNHREVDEWLIFWMDYFALFNPIYYTHLKYVESIMKSNLIMPHRMHKENEKYSVHL
jgi:hypothetical protein